MKAILFDLDGTVIDSQEGITKSAQYALSCVGINEPDLDKLKCFIGPPLNVTFGGRYGLPEDKVSEAIFRYRERYAESGIFECKVYDGVEEALIKLKKAGYVTALASSKPEEFCRLILEHFGLDVYFDFIVGATMDGKINTKSEVLAELERRLTGRHISKDEMCLIGDTHFDVEGARSFGIKCIAVSYGAETKEQLRRAQPYCICGSMGEALEAIIQL